MDWKRSLGAACLVVVAAFAVLLGADPAAARQGTEAGATAGSGTGAAPARCRIGAYVLAIHDVNIPANTFQADFWIWSDCPNDDFQPVETMEFVNATRVRLRLESSHEEAGVFWTERKVRGIFRHIWDVRNFPFDRHTLQIVLEEGEADASALVFEADLANTGYDRTLEIDGWRVTDFTVDAGLKTYDTTYGDPRLPAGGSSDYSVVTLNIGIERAELGSFIQYTAVAYAAFLLTLITYVLYLDRGSALGAQVGLLAGALFAVAINMASSSAALGAEGNLTLVDKIHIVVLVFILLTTVAVVVSRLLSDHGWTPAAVARVNHVALVVVAVSFVAVNAGLIVAAARGG